MTEGMIVPHSLEAEESLLGAMMLNRWAVEQALMLVVAEDFYKPSHAQVFTAIEDLYRDGCPVDPLTVAERLTEAKLLDRVGGRQALMRIQASTPASANAPHYAQIVIERAERRRFIALAEDLRGPAADLTVPIDDTVQTARTALDGLQQASGPLRAANYETWAANVDMAESWLIPGILERKDRIMLVAAEGQGKALSIDTPILTTRGWSNMWSLSVGDKVLSVNGEATTIIATTGILHGRECFKVTFSDGERIIADAEHEWVAIDYRTRQSDGPLPLKSQIVTTKQMAKSLHVGEVHNWSIPTTSPLYVTAIESIKSVPVKCIQVAHSSGIYLAGNTLIPTHNSFLLRLWALMSAAGVHWFTEKPMMPRRIIVFDVENSDRQIVRNTTRMYRLAETQAPGFNPDNFVIVPFTQLDITQRSNRLMVESYLTGHRPELIVIGPLYKILPPPNARFSYEESALLGIRILDDWRARFGVAILIEHHAPKGQAGRRDLDPLGSGAWMRWPEFGLKLEPDRDNPLLADLGHFRGQREVRAWPKQLERSTIPGQWPWRVPDRLRMMDDF